jgi:hypothetical protein
LSSSRRSDRQPAGRTVRDTFRRAVLLVGAAGLCALGSCKDEISPPTLGTVEIRLASRTSGGTEGARIYWGDSVLVASASEETYRFVLPAGTQIIRVEKDCSTVSPEAARSVEVEPGRGTTVSWEILPGTAIEVVSTMRGARIRLDGLDTGRATPATLSCIVSGTHHVSVSLLGAAAIGDSVQTVEVGEAGVRVDFDLEPLPQARTALLELFTATYCSNCSPADAAAESLWARLGPENGYISLQSHTRWPPRLDSLSTPSTLARNMFYGDLEGSPGGGLPVAMVAGIHKKQGAGTGNIEEIVGSYVELVDRIRPTPPAVAFHWLSADREPGVRARGRVRVVCLQELPEPATLMLTAASYKSGLSTPAYRGLETFQHVVREYQSLGSAASLGLAHRGDWADVDLEFLLGNDRRPSGSLWSEEKMGLVVFLQSTGSSKEILQAAHVRLP